VRSHRGIARFYRKDGLDLVIASRIIHHLDDPATFLTHVRGILKDNGWFMGNILNVCYYHHRIKFLLGKFPPISRAHKNFQSGPEFEKMVASQGLTRQTLTTPKKTIRAKIWPTAFNQDLIYVFRKE
jgi:2-polyprenyl-3-methyl-5-hydroxy-6-metoxy-1,4-benzoquinol methylase